MAHVEDFTFYNILSVPEVRHEINNHLPLNDRVALAIATHKISAKALLDLQAQIESLQREVVYLKSQPIRSLTFQRSFVYLSLDVP